MMLKRYFWLAYLFLVTVAAFWGGDLAKLYVSMHLATPLNRSEVQAQGPSAALTQQAPLSAYEVIAERNLFNATPPAPTSAETAATPAPPPPPPVSESVQATQLELRLAGVVIGNPSQRYAIIEDLRNRGTQKVYYIGDFIDQASIVAIEPTCIQLNVGNQREKLCFLDDTADNAATPATERTASAAPPQAPEPDLGNAGVLRVDEGTWRVSRELLMENFANLGSLSRQARVIPHIVQGQTIGFRLARLKSGSLLQQVGLQNGDVLQKVNGLAIHSPQEALQAYQQLQTEGTVRLEILRQNSPTTLTYEIR